MLTQTTEPIAPSTADVIRQDELEMLVQISRAEMVSFLSVARRIRAGATIEPGKWTFEPTEGELLELKELGPGATVSECGRVRLVDGPSPQPDTALPAPDAPAVPSFTRPEFEQMKDDLNQRGACMMVFREFIEEATSHEVELLDDVLRRHTQGAGEPLELIMTEAAKECDDDLSNTPWQLYRTFRGMVQNRAGAATPAEEYVVALVDQYRTKGTLGPADLERPGQEFARQYEAAVANAKRLLSVA